MGHVTKPEPATKPVAAAEPARDPVARPAGPAVDPAIDPLIGRVINGRYTVVEALAHGGMGRVYKAVQSPLDRIVAVKVMAGNLDDPSFNKRFFLEASVTAKLTHPNTITLFDYGQTEDGIFFTVMEFLTGRTLSEVLRAEGPLDQLRTIHICSQICRSLREAHKLGIIHRDIKPANVMLMRHGDDDDFVKVLDFGLVKIFSGVGPGSEITHAGTFMGSPHYISPEQARSQSPDQRCDIYSLGAVMYHMLTGRFPFHAANPVDLILKHVTEPPVPLTKLRPDLNIDPDLEAIVLRCLAKARENRYQSMHDLLQALKAEDLKLSGDSSRQRSVPAAPSAEAARQRDQGVPSQSAPAPVTPSEAHLLMEETPSLPTQKVPEMVSVQLASAPEAAARTEPRKRTGLLIEGLVAVVVVAGVAIWLFLSKPPAQPSVAPAPPGPQATGQQPRPAVEPSQPQAKVPEGPGQPRGAQEPPRAEVAPQPAPPSAPVAAPPEPSAAPSTAVSPAPQPAPAAPAPLLRIQSTPQAEVWENEKLLGSTPQEIPLEPAGVAKAQRIFVLRQRGYASYTVVQGPSDGPRTVDAQLKALSRLGQVTRKPKPAPAPAAKAAPPPPPPPRHDNNDILLDR
jgi:serine/threonine protein kinase